MALFPYSPYFVFGKSGSHCLKLSGARYIVYKKDYDEPCDSDADYDSDPDSETEPDYDCYPDSE